MLTQFANAIFLLNGEGWQNGTPYTFVMWLGLATIALANQYLREIRKKRIFLKQLKSVKSQKIAFSLTFKYIQMEKK